MKIAPAFSTADQRWAWVAGLFEGEGCIHLDVQKRGKRRMLSLVSTDRDVLKLLLVIVRGGCIRVKFTEGNRRKPAWYWSAANWKDINRIGSRILPFLRERRSAKMVALLADAPLRGSGLCRRGLHRIHGEGADIYVSKTTGHYQCGACAREREKRKRRERKAAA